MSADTNDLRFLAGGGEMGALTRNKDWNNHPIGHPSGWPQSLRTSLSILLNSRFPMFLWWGPELTCFYNDAYRPSLGKEGKHPTILGQPAAEAWPEIWDIIKPLIDQVLAGNGATWSEDQLIPIYRNGNIEDVYWTFSYSPVYDDAAQINGVLVTCAETTEKVLTAKKLEQSFRNIRNIILQAPVAMCIFRGPTHIVEIANDRMFELWGKPAGEVLNKPIFEGLPEAQNQGFEELLDNVLRTGETVIADGLPVTLPREDTIDTVYVNFVYEAYREEDGTISGVMAVANEVTAQVMANKKMAESESNFRQLADFLPEMVWTTDEKGAQTFASKRWKAFTGHDPYDQTSFAKMIHPDDLERVGKVWSESLVSGNTYKTEARLIDTTGAYQWFYVNGEPIRNENGIIEKWVGAFTNINEQKKTEEKLLQAFRSVEESEKRFRNVADSAPVLIWMAGTDKFCHFFNKAWLRFTGRTMEENGNGWTDGIHPEDRVKYINVFNAAFDKQQEFHTQYRLKRHDGEYRWISDNGVPRFTTDGIFEGYIGACMDIHETIIYQQKLKENEDRLQMVINASELGTFELNLKTGEPFYSKRYIEILGYKELTTLTHPEILKHLHPEDRPTRDAAMKEAMATGTLYFKSRLVWNDQSVHWIEAKGKVFYDAGNQPAKLIGTIGDITEEKYREQVLRESEAKFRLLADSMPQHIWTADTEGNLNYFNSSVYSYSGLSPEQIDAGGWIQIVHPDDREENIKQWVDAITTGRDFLLEHRFRRHDGEYRWQLSRAIPQKDAAGNIQMWVGTSTDIQEQKTFANELEKQVQERTRELEQKNSDLEKMNTELQSFAYVSSHDLQEPLRKIQTFASRIIEKEEQNLSANGRDYFRRMQEAANRMQTLIQDLLTYSRTNTTEREFNTVNLATIFAKVRNDIKEILLEKKAVIEESDMRDVYIIPFQFRQLLLNLVGNSLKFAKPGTAPHIKVTSRITSGKSSGIDVLAASLNYCHITITDNGIGFESKYGTRIFEVFQRLHTKEEYSGTGIGLAIVKKIVENHNGRIIATGEPGKGARFDIYIPAP